MQLCARVCVCVCVCEGVRACYVLVLCGCVCGVFVLVVVRMHGCMPRVHSRSFSHNTTHLVATERSHHAVANVRRSAGTAAPVQRSLVHQGSCGVRGVR